MTTDMKSLYECHCCSYKAGRLKLLLQHFHLVHSIDKAFRFMCFVKPCSKQYKNTRSFLHHLKNSHKQFYTEHNFGRPVKGENIDVSYMHNYPDDECYMDTDDQPSCGDINHNSPILQNAETHDFDYQRWIASFVLNIRENHNANKAICSAVVDEIKTLVELSNDCLTSKVVGLLNCADDDSSKHAVNEVKFQNTQIVVDACSSLATPNQLSNYVKNYMDYVKPVEIEIGNDTDGTSHSVVYVPILKTLDKLLQHEDVLAEVLEDRKSVDGIMRDFCDGSSYNSNPIFQQATKSLQIQFYYDDFHLTNPIGTKAKKYKTSAVYFILGNIHPRHRAKLDVIQLVSLSLYHNVVSNHGLDAMLKPLLDDLITLETHGITVNHGATDFHFRGTVSFIAADNLAAHALGKFPVNFGTAQRICRFCRTREEFQGVFNEEQFQPRTKTAHDAQIQAIQEDSSLAEVYGVKGKAALGTLQYYHVIGGLPPDISHDLFEGTVPDVVATVLSTILGNNLESINNLNKALDGFPYSHIDKSNKPPSHTTCEWQGETEIHTVSDVVFCAYHSIHNGSKHRGRRWSLGSNVEIDGCDRDSVCQFFLLGRCRIYGACYWRLFRLLCVLLS